MSGSLLDTSILIAAAEPSGGLPDAAAISVITIGELRAGVLLARTTELRSTRERRLAAIRAAFVPLPIDEEISDRYGELLAHVRSTRGSAKASDLLIVATAAATSRELYTLDRRQAAVARAIGVEVVAP